MTLRLAVDLLLRVGATVNAANEYGATAPLAAANADLTMSAKLIGRRRRRQRAPIVGRNATHGGGPPSNVDTVRVLLAGGAIPTLVKLMAGKLR